jgi:cytochrome c-type biogenesis protein CcmE
LVLFYKKEQFCFFEKKQQKTFASLGGSPFMTRKSRRLAIVVACMVGLGSAAALTLNAFSHDLVFFMTPADIAERNPPPGQTIRLGGMVEAGSLHKASLDGAPVAQFRVTDGKTAIGVSYTGILPDLFREGQGVVAIGTLTPDHRFTAQEVLAKHDEKYMPKDVAEALKKRGYQIPKTAGGGV